MCRLNALNSACAGEFIQIGLSADTIHRRTTMFDRHPDLAAALISTTARRGGYVRPDHLPWQTPE
jgi:hypothetical protein